MKIQFINFIFFNLFIILKKYHFKYLKPGKLGEIPIKLIKIDNILIQ